MLSESFLPKIEPLPCDSLTTVFARISPTTLVGASVVTVLLEI